MTVYNVENRAIINNKQGRADIGSNIKGTVTNPDGSYTFHFSPKKPEGIPEANWVQTVPGRDFITVLRLYGVDLPFFDQTWKPDDVVKVE